MATTAADAKMRCFDIIDRFPQEQLPSLAASLETMYKMIEDAIDDAFCLALAERHSQRPDKNEPGVLLENFASELGIVLGEDDAD